MQHLDRILQIIRSVCPQQVFILQSVFPNIGCFTSLAYTPGIWATGFIVSSERQSGVNEIADVSKRQ